MWLTRLAVLLAGCAAVVPGSVAADDTGGQVVLSIKVVETSPQGKVVKVLAEPTIATPVGRPFSFASGGLAESRSGGGQFEVGTRATGQLQRTDQAVVQLALKLQIASAVPQDDDPQTDVVVTQTLELRTALRLGQTKRLKCSTSQWCEVRVDAVR